MTPHEYQKLAELTENKDYVGIGERFTRSIQMIRIDHASRGLCTESGEFADTVKRFIEYGIPIDLVNLLEELGDILWYVALACNAMGTSIEEVMDKNIKKLESRYPAKFTSKDALLRNLDAERKILED